MSRLTIVALGLAAAALIALAVVFTGGAPGGLVILSVVVDGAAVLTGLAAWQWAKVDPEAGAAWPGAAAAGAGALAGLAMLIWVIMLASHVS